MSANRVLRLASLVAQRGGAAAFVRSLSSPIEPSYISQLVNGHRSFGEKAAHKIATLAGLPSNYFDMIEGKRGGGREDDPLQGHSNASIARALGVVGESVRLWRANGIPAERVPEVERVTGVPRHILRPDLFSFCTNSAAADGRYAAMAIDLSETLLALERAEAEQFVWEECRPFVREVLAKHGRLPA